MNRRSALSITMLSAMMGLTGCVSDSSTAIRWQQPELAPQFADAESPAGIWLLSSQMTEHANYAGNEVITESRSRQLVVLEETTDGKYRLHECSSGVDVYYAAVDLEMKNSELTGAVSFTDYDATTPYSETDQIQLSYQGNALSGNVISYDHNLDGSFDGKQSAYIEGHKISNAQTLATLTQEEITELLGNQLNRDSTDQVLGPTCAGMASVTTTGTRWSLDVVSDAVADIMAPEQAPDLMVASEALR